MGWAVRRETALLDFGRDLQRGAAAPGKSFTAEQLATEIGTPDKTEIVFKILEHLAANKHSGVKKRVKTPWFASTYRSA